MQHVTIIAEAGVNHNGSESIALELIDAAADAGADIVKFQVFRAASVISVHAAKAAYQQAATGSVESQLEMVQKLELPMEAFQRLAAHCALQSIGFLATPFDFPSIDLLADMGLPLIKIPSGELTNLPYLRKIGKLRRELIMSTGMCEMREIGEALGILERAGTSRDRITLLHCTTEYPCPLDEVNLLAMRTLLEAFPGIKGVGYSDHTTGISVPVAATALGATIIEKHFTLDKNMEGPDHKASLEPDELARMVRAVREIELALGDGRKMPSLSEGKNREVVRKSIVAARTIRKGDIFTQENLTVKRPGSGLSPMAWDSVVGAAAARDYSPDDMIDDLVGL